MRTKTESGTRAGFFSTMRIGTRVIVVLATIMVFIVSLGIYSSVNLKNLNDSDTILYEQNAKPLASMGQHRTTFLRAFINLLQAATTKDATERAAQLARAEERLQHAERAFAELRAAVQNPEVIKKVEESHAIYMAMKTSLAAIPEMIRSGIRKVPSSC